MLTKKLSEGIAHKIPADLRKTLTSSPNARATWENITPIARNEWICWVVDPKQPETRADHVRRAGIELAKGKRRPCCWIGCTHRTDKAMSASQKFILGKRGAKK